MTTYLLSYNYIDYIGSYMLLDTSGSIHSELPLLYVIHSKFEK